MPFRVELLWSDLLVWLLVAGVIGLVLYTRKRPHLSAPWVRVGASASGMAAATVLFFFVLTGLLDSVHYRSALPVQGGKPAWSTELHSLLDRALEPLRASREKTYSAPLATHLFAKETVVLPDGREDRLFPRLRHGGAHLADPQADRWADVAARAFRGFSLALLLWFVAAIGVAAMTARRTESGIEAAWREVWSGRTPLQWRAVLCALGAVLVVAGPVAALATHYHVLGTDKVGQDVLYQALKSVRTGLVIGTLATLVTLPFALVLGVMAGYFRGWIDDLIQYLYTTLSSIPGVLLIAAAVLMMQVYVENHQELFPSTEIRADVRLLALCVILGITSWTGLCRLLRGEVLKLRELEYVQAAQAFGVSHWRIMMRHLTPNVMHIVMIALVMDFSGLVLAEAVLSYIGVGVDPSMISFGTMINGARLEMAREPMVWWSLAAAFVFMLALVLAANLFADAVRDAFDPRLRAAGGRA
ncbi:MAG: ABC transporter permease [Burkholderiales bacterium]|nr:ABC transporter permease [Burkholderiales bacterium]